MKDRDAAFVVLCGKFADYKGSQEACLRYLADQKARYPGYRGRVCLDSAPNLPRLQYVDTAYRV